MLDPLIHNLLPSTTHLQSFGYWIAFLAALLETTFVVGMFLPGSTVLLLIGAFSATDQLDFQGVFWFAVAGAILGDNINYWLGQHYGRRWLKGGVWFLRQAHFEQARLFFDRHGAQSVFLGRFVPTIKEVVPFIAGSVGMRHRSFIFWNLLGAVGWGLEWVGGGYLFAQSLNLAQIWLPRFGLLIAALLILSLLFWLLKHFVIHHGRQWGELAASVFLEVLQTIRDNSEVRRLVAAHPGFFGFLSRRLDRRRFSGLPLTLIGLAFVYVLVLFGGLIEDLLTSDPIVFLDKGLAQLVAVARPPALARVAYWVTELGIWQVVVPGVVAAALLLGSLNRPLLALPLMVSVAGSSLFTALGKLAFHRPRPVEAMLAEHSYAFPSGHATIAVAFYGFIGYLLIRGSKRWTHRVNLFFATLFLVLLIGLSRIVLGVHYLSDVLSGYLVGTLWLIVAIGITEWLVATGRVDLRSKPRPGSRWAVTGSLTALLAWYTCFTLLHPPHFVEPTQPQTVQVNGDIVDYLKQHRPVRTRTLLGGPQQPLSLLIVSPDEQTLRRLFLQSGWRVPAGPGPGAILRLIREGLDDENAPLAPVFWNGRLYDLAFEKRVGNAADKQLLAVQLWRTPLTSPQGFLYVGTTRAFRGMRWHLLRSMDPDMDKARDRVWNTLKQSPLINASRLTPFAATLVGHTPTGQDYFTRGELRLIQLKKP